MMEWGKKPLFINKKLTNTFSFSFSRLERIWGYKLKLTFRILSSIVWPSD